MNRLFCIFFVVFFSFIAVKSLLVPGLPPTHDGEYHVIRFYEFDKTLKAGDFYPRWAADLNNGYGVPLFTYVYPFPNYFASFLHLFGISFIDAFKLNMFFATIIGSICMYLWAKIYWGEMGGIVSSVFYTFSPYHFVDIYIRGSVGEVWALAFFPAFLWSITKFFMEQKDRYKILSGIFLSLIIFSHNILALMFFPFMLSYIGLLFFAEQNKKSMVLNVLYILFLGLGLSAVFWLPAIAEIKYVRGLQIYDIKNNFPQLYQLLIPSWGSGFSNGELTNQMSLQIGVANMISFFGSIIALFIFMKKKNINVASRIAFFLLWATVIFFLMLSISLSIWNLIPFMNYFQFPWRLLSLAILIFSFLAGCIVTLTKNKIFVGVIILLPILFGFGYAKPPFYFNRDDMYYVSRPNFIDGTNSPGDYFNTTWFQKGIKKQKEKMILNNGKITSSFVSQTTYKYTIFSASGSDATINTAYFPGWTVLVDTNRVNVSSTSKGLMTFHVPAGTHKIAIQLKNTLIQNLAVFCSLTAGVFILIHFARLLAVSNFLGKYGKNKK